MRLAWALVCFAATAGCGDHSAGDDSQIAVRVNKGEISIHQVQAVLQRQPRLMTEQPGTAPARVLEVLIDQELAAQAARAQGLDKEPAFVQAMEAARREALAGAFHDIAAAKVTSPSSDEIDRYFDAHPELFAKRRLYVLQEFAFAADPDQLEKLKEPLTRTRNVAEVTDLLRNAKINSHTRQFVQAAEDLPIALLEPMGRLEQGGSLLLPQVTGARIFNVLHVQQAPIDRLAAAPRIAGFLIAERQRQAVASSMTELRNAAKLEYLGSFAKGASAAAASASESAR